MAEVELDGVWKRYPDGTEAVKDLSLSIDDGEFVILVGPSGCGKSTALRMVAGLEEISDGTLKIGDKVVNNLTPKERDIAMVFQSYALYPHMSVADNMGFALKLAKVPKDEIRKRVEEAAEILGLKEYLDRKPRALSGGQRQRVAMGRAIVRSPQAFLLDEPLSNLDAKLRVQMRAEIAQLQSRLGVTTVYVTHDQIEAMTMGDRIAVMSLGVLQQLDTPQNLYDRPANKFVAGFIGSPSMNFIDVTMQGEGNSIYAATPGFRMRVPDLKAPALQPYIGQTLSMGIRPEHLVERSHMNGNIPADSVIPVTVDVIELLGNEIFVYLTNAGATITARMDPSIRLERGQTIEVAAEPDKLHFFDPKTDAAIR